MFATKGRLKVTLLVVGVLAVGLGMQLFRQMMRRLLMETVLRAPIMRKPFQPQLIARNIHIPSRISTMCIDAKVVPVYRYGKLLGDYDKASARSILGLAVILLHSRRRLKHLAHAKRKCKI